MQTTLPKFTDAKAALKALPLGAIRAFEKIVGKTHVLKNAEELTTYECEATLLFKALPQLVVLPATPEEVQQVVQACIKFKLPYVARGAGTGLSGGSIAINGGVVIALARLNQIAEIDPINQTATVGVGVVNAHLSQATKAHNLFYAPDPSSQYSCTIGGNIAQNAGGIHCLKYGVTVDHILALQMVTPDGQLQWIGNKMGYAGATHFVGFLTGSEGTLGVVTQAIVKLTPMPKAVVVYLASFAATQHATEAVTAIMASGLTPAALEFMDAFTTQSVNAAFNVGFSPEAKAILLIELDGPSESLAEQEQQLVNCLKRHSPILIERADEEIDRQRLWKARKSAAASYGYYMPSFYLHDCVIPRSKLTQLITAIEAIGQEYNVLIGNVFHAGDGNLHPNILFDPNNPELLKRALTAGEKILEACLDVGGVLTGEHGVGLEKQQYMDQQYGPETLGVMTQLKKAIDTHGLSNPGKVLPVRSTCAEAGCAENHERLQHIVKNDLGWV